MSKSVRGRGLAVVIALLLPLIIVGLQNIAAQPLVWIVYADRQDVSIDLASTTLSDEIHAMGCNARNVELSELSSIPLYSRVIVLIGHGQEEGIIGAGGLIPWSNLYDSLRSRMSMHTVVLACHSPSDVQSGVFGFMGEVDAEAGALITSWYISQAFDLSIQTTGFDKRVLEAQTALEHPLARYVYFVHGYFGDPSVFANMKAYLDSQPISEDYAGWLDFSYCEVNGAYTTDAKNLLHQITTASDYANNFTSHLINNHGPGTQINIVAHSLGGIIVREMLALSRTTLENAGIDVGTVITLGTPHQGTYLADPGNLLAAMALLYPYVTAAQFWPSPVFYSLHPYSLLMLNLNANPASYSEGIRWYTAAGVDTFLSLPFIAIHGEYSDIIVGEGRAKLSFADSAPTFYHTIHGELADDLEQTTFGSVATWLGIDDDYDGDMLDDDMETYVYYTNANDWDSDDDGISDGHEILYHNTNPLAWSTDGDILSDWQEITWGYDPLDTDNPIDAQELTYSAWQFGGTTGCVRANHYTAMDYVKVYVKYKNSLGYWTAYFYVGTDYTPTYYGDYYVSWSLLQGYVQMQVNVQAYDSEDHYLGSDQQYVTLPGGGGGGGGGDPVPE